MRFLEIIKSNGDIDYIQLTDGDIIKNMEDVQRIAKDNKIVFWWDINWYSIVDENGVILDD